MGIKRDLKDTVRDTKNFFKGYSRIQVKLRQATSIDPWGPATIQMEEVARATHSPTLLGDLIYVFDRRLNDHGKYWRHVYKSLVTMEYCIVCGSESFVRYAKDTIYVIKTLKEFQYIDSMGRDQGAMVRQKSREIVALLQNETALAEARRTKTIPRANIDTTRSPSPMSNQPSRLQTRTSSRASAGRHDDDQLQRAIEESKRTAVEEARRRASSDDAFFSNMQSSSAHRSSSSSYERDVARHATEKAARHATNLTITHDQPRIVLTQVPHTTIVQKSTHESPTGTHHHDTAIERFDFMDDDPFSQVNMGGRHDDAGTEDPFANAEELDLDPFADAEEADATRPTIETNTKRDDPHGRHNRRHSRSQAVFSVPMPRNPLDKTPSGADNIGAKPVKPMNLTPGFSTRAPANNQHFN